MLSMHACRRTCCRSLQQTRHLSTPADKFALCPFNILIDIIAGQLALHAACLNASSCGDLHAYVRSWHNLQARPQRSRREVCSSSYLQACFSLWPAGNVQDVGDACMQA